MIDEKYIPKDAVWISESVIALIIGDVYESIIDGEMCTFMNLKIISYVN